MRGVSPGLSVLLWCRVALAQPAAPAQDKADDHDADSVQEIAPEDPAPEDPAPKPEVPAPEVPAPSKPREQVHTMDELAVPATYLRFGINFFGDTSLTFTSPDRPHSAFAIGTLGLRMLGQLSPSLDALAELAFETTSQGPLADIEQVALRWRKGPGLLEVGRVHTNFGYWNTAYHHGLWLQTPIERPRALRFEDEGGLLPVHWVGAHYTLVPGSGAFAVTLGIGNGRGDIVDDIRVSDDTNEAKATLVKVRYKTSTFEAGAGAIYDVIAPANAMVRPALPGQRLHELIGNAYVALRTDGPILIGEGYAFRHQTSNESWMTYAAYGLVGYAIAEGAVLYTAADVVHGASDDPFFRPDTSTPGLDVLELLLGARIDVSTWSALKLELRFEHPEAGEDDYGGALNWSFGL